MRTVEHDTWSIEKTYPTARSRVFAAWADSDLKQRWFAGPDGQPNNDLFMDFSIGGTERTQGVTPDGDRYTYAAEYRDIVADERIITTYVMTLNGRRISVSVATVEFTDEGNGTRLVYTEQGSYLDGLDIPASRRGGVGTDLEHLGRVLEQVGR